MTKLERLLNIIEHYSQGNKAQFAKKLSVSPQVIDGWQKRNSFDPYVILEHCPEISPDWLLFGRGEMLRNSEQDSMPALQSSIAPEAMQPSSELDEPSGMSVDFAGIAERLREFVAYRHITQAQLANIIGIPKSTLTCYLTQNRRGIAGDAFVRIACAFPYLNIRWLMTGEGGMLDNIADVGKLRKELEHTKELYAFEHETLTVMRETLQQANQTITDLRRDLASKNNATATSAIQRTA